MTIACHVKKVTWSNITIVITSRVPQSYGQQHVYLLPHRTFLQHISGSLIRYEIGTACIPKEWGRYCFHRCLSVHISEGGGTPSGQRGGGLVPPSGWWRIPPSGQPMGRGYPHLADGEGGTPIWLGNTPSS